MRYTMKIRLSGMVNDSIVDGPGIRMTVFTQGCSHHCLGCQNPQTHDPFGGYEEDTDNIIKKMKENPLLDGITLSGGEPLEQAKACAQIAKAAHQAGLNVWVYTGYTWEELIQKNDTNQMDLLKNTDILVDGPFLIEQRSLELYFKGSKNQRTICCMESLQKKTILLQEEKN